MLGAVVGFFSAVLSAIIATLNYLFVHDLVGFIIMLAVFAVGSILTIFEWASSAGSMVALKIGIILVNIFALSFQMYNDIMDSDGIVG